VTGDKKEIYKLARKSFLVTATDGDGGPEDFIHSELLILVDKQKRIRGFYNGTMPAEVDNLVRDISRLKKEE
jgi:protein SCO1/2